MSARLSLRNVNSRTCIAQSHHHQMAVSHVGQALPWIGLLNQWEESIHFDARWRTLFWSKGDLTGMNPFCFRCSGAIKIDENPLIVSIF